MGIAGCCCRHQSGGAKKEAKRLISWFESPAFFMESRLDTCFVSDQGSADRRRHLGIELSLLTVSRQGERSLELYITRLLLLSLQSYLRHQHLSLLVAFVKHTTLFR